MPDREVKTIRDLTYYQYAKIIAKSALGPDAKTSAYGFIKNTFRKLRNSEKEWSEILREDKQLVEGEKRCVYCGSEKDLQWEHIVPRSLLINDRCPACDRIQGIHNQIWACKACNSKKKTKGLYHFFRELYPEARRLSDTLPALLEKKYLKTIYYCHSCKGTLDWDCGGRELSVLDLDLTA
jgi:5-methylcytosine-specific restriction endonuclease McrA